MLTARISLTIADVLAYQHVVRQRLRTSSRTSLTRQVINIGLAMSLGVVLTAGDAMLAKWAGYRSNPWTMIAGLCAGVAVVLAAIWNSQRKMGASMLRPDGPTLSDHSVVVGDDGVRVHGSHHDAHYRWTAFEAVSEHDGLIILWLEPGLGMIVPRKAFPDAAAADAFRDAVGARVKGTGA